MKKIRSFLMIAIVLVGLPVSAKALGFGAPVLKSHLNEVLDVRVPLLLADNESLNSVFVEFAKPNEYRLVGLEPYTDLSGLRISVEHTEGGELYVLVSSVSVVQAPMLSLLLKARIGHSIYYKQLQLLLDTMELGARTHAVQSKQAYSPPAVDKGAMQNSAGHDDDWARTWRYGPVRSGDSLSTIAYRLRKDKRWSNHDVMLALYRFNPDAFIQHDINRLKSGVWLQVPHEKALKKLLKQAPTAYEIVKRNAQPLAKKLAKPEPKPENAHATETKQEATTQLRYVGRIALGNDVAASNAESEASANKHSEHLQEKMNQLYQQAMDDHLQMANLNQNISAIRDDIGKLSNDIIALKEQQSLMQQQMTDSPSTTYWMQGFLLLCLLNIMLLGLFLYHRYQLRKKEKYDIEEAYFKKKTESATQLATEPSAAPIKGEVRKKHLLENKIYDIENHLNLRNYEAVENILKQLSKSERDHFGVCALNARLYHETGRLDERDALIRSKQESLNAQQWHLLCDRLPLNVWHALHQSGVIKDNGTLLNVDEGLAGLDHHEEVPEIDISSLEQENLESSLADTMKMVGAIGFKQQTQQEKVPSAEDSGLDFEPEPEKEQIPDIEANFLDLDELEFKTVDEQQPVADALEGDDEFTSTVFMKPQGK